MTSTQQSKLLASLFEQLDAEDRFTVLHIGAALPETVAFFSAYRCKLHFVDLFAELPIVAHEEEGPSLQQQFAELLPPGGTRLDICLFWDVFNFLGSEAIEALVQTLQPSLHSRSLAHGFAVHNLKTPQGGQVYGITDLHHLSVRTRPERLSGYAPHNQGQLKRLLSCYEFTRSVLLPDSRLELLMRARMQAPG